MPFCRMSLNIGASRRIAMALLESNSASLEMAATRSPASEYFSIRYRVTGYDDIIASARPSTTA